MPLCVMYREIYRLCPNQKSLCLICEIANTLVHFKKNAIKTVLLTHFMEWPKKYFMKWAIPSVKAEASCMKAFYCITVTINTNSQYIWIFLYKAAYSCDRK